MYHDTLTVGTNFSRLNFLSSKHTSMLDESITSAYDFYLEHFLIAKNVGKTDDSAHETTNKMHAMVFNVQQYMLTIPSSIECY